MSEATDMMELMMSVKYMDPRDKMTMEAVLNELAQLQKYRNTIAEYCVDRINHIKNSRRDSLKPAPGEDIAAWSRYESNYALGKMDAYKDIIRYGGE